MTETFTHAPLAFGPHQPPRFYRGGAGLARFRGGARLGSHTPEDFIASTTEVFSGGGVGLSVLPDGSTLRDAIAADPIGFLGTEHVDRFGADPALLVKLLDTGERLLVHFHPDGDFARRHLGCRHGKNEAWLITDLVADPEDETSGFVYLGFRQDVSSEVAHGWVATQDRAAMLDSLNRVAVRPGQTYFVPAGVPHAIGAGVTMVEAQEPVDLSLLLEWEGFDIDGENEGHLGVGFDTALQALNRTAWSQADLDLATSTRAGAQVRPGVLRLLPEAADPYFRVERITPEKAEETGGVDLDPAFAIVVVSDGSGALEYGEDGKRFEVTAGSTFLVPHGVGRTRITGSLTALRCRPPAPEDAEAAR